MSIHSLWYKRRFHIGTPKNMEKYERILNAAIKVFAEQGFHQSTVSQIAGEAGVADGTIYLYFKNKDDILVQFYEFKTSQVFQRFRKEVDKVDTAVEKLRRLIYTHLYEFQNDRHMAIVFQAETHQKKRLAGEQIRKISKLYRDIISELVELGQEDGTMRRDLYLGLVKRFINGAIDEVINSWIHTDGSYDLVSMADPLADLIIRGIGNHGVASPVKVRHLPKEQKGNPVIT
ncbi:MAG: TetR/AcrR family transcriptional regulator [Desulfobacteraceae bacterium]|nr:TetR/AcrR family transcriptional regulator [Desulfobacteraceae bacterium]